jgi:hypothetical protein
MDSLRMNLKIGSQVVVFLLCVFLSTHTTVFSAGMECYIQDTLCFPIPDKRTDYISDELLLLFPKSYSKEKQKHLLARYQLDEIESDDLASLGLSLSKTDTNGQDALEVKEKINRIYEDIEAATNNVYVSSVNASAKTTKEYYPHSLTGAGRARGYSSGKGVLIGLIDGPVDKNHRGYNQKNIERIDLVPNLPKSHRYLLHGTAMAGVLIAHKPEIGIAPDARLLAISAFAVNLEDKSASSSALVAKAIDIAIQRKVNILNLSFAGGEDPLVSRLIRKAIDAGIFVVAACGNDASENPVFPAALSGVIAVTAVDHRKKLYSEANTGSYIDVAAPGVGILTTGPGGRYDFSTGTSIATANVSASLALLLAKNPNIQRDILSATALDLGKPGHDDAYGDGLINVMKAMQRLGINTRL